MPFDERLRQKQIIERSVPRLGATPHPGAEPSSFPPPPVEDYRPGVAGGPSPSIREPRHQADRAVHWIKITAAGMAAIGALYTTLKPVVVWFWTRPSEAELDAARMSCNAAAAASAKAAIDPLLQRLSELEKEKKRNGQRWDQFDRWTAQKKRPNTTAPPKFGPEAERRGEARYDDGIDQE
jgi:hypothetical protein